MEKVISIFGGNIGGVKGSSIGSQGDAMLEGDRYTELLQDTRTACVFLLR